MRDGEIGRQPQKHRRGYDLPRDACPYCSHTIPSPKPAPRNWALGGRHTASLLNA
jgi:hypothetical protein